MSDVITRKQGIYLIILIILGLVFVSIPFIAGKELLINNMSFFMILPFFFIGLMVVLGIILFYDEVIEEIKRGFE